MRIGVLAVVVVMALAGRASAWKMFTGSPSDWQTNVPIDTEIQTYGEPGDVFTLEGDAAPEELRAQALVRHLVRLVPAQPLLPLHAYTLRLRGARVVTFVTGTQLAMPRRAEPVEWHGVSYPERRAEPVEWHRAGYVVAPRTVRGGVMWLLCALAGLVLLFELVRWARFWAASRAPRE